MVLQEEKDDYGVLACRLAMTEPRNPPTLPVVVFMGETLRVVVRHDGLLLFLKRATGIAYSAVRVSRLIDVEEAEEELVLRGAFGADFRGELEDERRVPVLGETLSGVAAAIRTKLALPRPVLEVTEERIREAPASLAGALIRVRGVWYRGFEASSLGKAWFDPTNAMSAAVPMEHAAWVDVTCLVESSDGVDGYGHLGMWPAALRMYSGNVISPARPLRGMGNG